MDMAGKKKSCQAIFLIFGPLKLWQYLRCYFKIAKSVFTFNEHQQLQYLDLLNTFWISMLKFCMIIKTVSIKLNGFVFVMTLRSILTVPWMELGGQTSITCPKSGYNASIHFHCKVSVM